MSTLSTSAPRPATEALQRHSAPCRPALVGHDVLGECGYRIRRSAIAERPTSSSRTRPAWIVSGDFTEPQCRDSCAVDAERLLGTDPDRINDAAAASFRPRCEPATLSVPWRSYQQQKRYFADFDFWHLLVVVVLPGTDTLTTKLVRFVVAHGMRAPRSVEAFHLATAARPASTMEGSVCGDPRTGGIGRHSGHRRVSGLYCSLVRHQVVRGPC